MTVVVTGADLSIAEVVAVARDLEDASIAPDASERMSAARGVVDRALQRGDAVYGLTTGVGAGKDRRVDPVEAAAHSRRIVRSHLVGVGAPFPPEVVRAAALVLVNGFAAGRSGVRPEIASRLIDALNGHKLPEIHALGSVGQADLAPLAELTDGVLGDVELAPGEGLALLSSNAFSTGHAALAVADAGALLDALDVSGAVSLEAFGSNLSILHPVVSTARPFPGLMSTLGRLRALLDGSRLWDEGEARDLQDALTFRSLPQVHGAARDALTFAERQVTIELNASQNNPIVVPDEDRLISTANFDSTALAVALDAVRIGLAPPISSGSERVVKLLDEPWSGLPRGLVEPDADGLSYLAITVQSLAAEARLHAAPVSAETGSSAHAEGIEDRISLAPLAARRTAEMMALGSRVAAIELLVASQALEVRASKPFGRGVERALALVREHAAFMAPGDIVPPDPERLVELVRSGLRSALP